MSTKIPKPRVTLITQNEFWRNGAGIWARTREVVRFLAAHTQLRVLVAKPLNVPPGPQDIAALDCRFEFTAPGIQGRVTHDQVKAWIPHTLHAAPADICWVDKTELSWVLPILPRGARTVVDTHDLMSRRARSFASVGVPGVAPVTEEEERAILARYDRVLCIQQEDRDIVREWLGPGRALLVPHPTPLHRHALRDEVSSIVFVASDWIANIDGIRWFLDEIWPQVARPGLFLDIYGDICRPLAQLPADPGVPGMRLHGRVDSLDAVYSQADIVINPVRVGAGLKIKSVEALANGLPLVTTGEGARGLRFLDQKALWIADDPADFAAALNQLVTDAPRRRTLADEACAYAGQHCTPDACFGEVLAWLRQAKRR